MTMKNAKSIGTWILSGFCVGVGLIIGWMVGRFTWTHIMVGFLAFVGLCVLATLTYAAIFDETTEQEDEMTYPQPQGWDKSYEN